MEDKDIQRRLRGFEAVWKRVGAAKGSAAAAAQAQGLKLMPGRGRTAGGQRYKPGRG